MIRALTFFSLLVCAVLAHAEPAPARDEVRRARAHFRQGQAYQEAGAYDQAVSEFQTAYELTPLPALLFNLGQALRLEGDKPAALDAYRRFLEAVPDGRGSDEARAHVARLTAAIADEEAARRAELRSPEPTTPPPAPVVAAPAPPAVTLVAAPLRTPVYKRWWLWTTVGGVAAVGLAVGLGVGLTRGTHYPSAADATDGTVRF